MQSYGLEDNFTPDDIEALILQMQAEAEAAAESGTTESTGTETDGGAVLVSSSRYAQTNLQKEEITSPALDKTGKDTSESGNADEYKGVIGALVGFTCGILLVIVVIGVLLFKQGSRKMQKKQNN